MHSKSDQVFYYSVFHPLFFLLLLLSSLSPGVDWGAGLYFPTGFARAGPVAGFQGDTLLLAFSDLRQVGLCLPRGPLSFVFSFFFLPPPRLFHPFSYPPLILLLHFLCIVFIYLVFFAFIVNPNWSEIRQAKNILNDNVPSLKQDY